MTGPHDSVIGVQTDLVLTRFLRGVPVRFETATGDARINGVLVEVDERTGKAVTIERLQVKK
jgi:2',3'-cyclic-nucleotide 2'-phosphodiesterase